MPKPVDPFDVKECLFNGLSIIVLKLKATISGYASATDTVTKTAHGHIVGDALARVSGTGWTGAAVGDIVYVVEAPTADTFKVSETRGGTALTLGTSTDGVFRKAFVFGSKFITDKVAQEEKPLERPDAGGVLREVRNPMTKQGQSWTFDLDEVKRLPKIFSKGMAGRIVADCKLYIPDQDDEADFCSLVSEEFACTVTREGDVGVGNSEHSKATLNVKSNKLGVVEFDTDVDLSA